MAKYTHDAIMGTFTEMLQEMPFDKITVSELVRRCNISPNTFYYHYHDIYDLLNAWFMDGMNKFISENRDVTSWRDIIKQILRLCKEHDAATYHIYNGLSRDSFERFAFQQSNDIIQLSLLQMAGRIGMKVPEEKLKPVGMACRYMALGFFLHFIWNKMTDDIDRIVDEFSDMIEDFVFLEFSK